MLLVLNEDHLSPRKIKNNFILKYKYDIFLILITKP